jgi:hypothetical protein
MSECCAVVVGSSWFCRSQQRGVECVFGCFYGSQQLLDVGITEVKTLTGLIAQSRL